MACVRLENPEINANKEKQLEKNKSKGRGNKKDIQIKLTSLSCLSSSIWPDISDLLVYVKAKDTCQERQKNSDTIREREKGRENEQVM